MVAALAALLLAAQAEPPVFVAHTTAPQPVTGPLDRLDAGWSPTLGGAKVAAGTLVSLRRADRPRPDLPSEPHVLLTNGDRLPGVVAGVQPEALMVRPMLRDNRPAEPDPVRVPLSLVVAARLRYGPPPPAPAGKRPRDVVVLRNGDRLAGTLAGGDNRTLTLKPADGPDVTVEVPKVSEVLFNTELTRQPRVKGPFARLTLANGGRLGLSAATLAGGELTAKTVFGATLRVPLAEVVALDVRQGPADELSDLKPKRYQHTPFAPASAAAWPLAADGSVGGGPLRLSTDLGPETFDKGVSLHSRSQVTFPLGGDYRRFDALVGLHDHPDAGRRGSARVAVLVDGKPRGDLGELTHAGGPKPVRVDVTGANELTLVVDFGRGGDVQDHVDWVEARLVK